MPNIQGREFLIGADPEVFIVDSNGEPVSAYGLAPGTKEKPFAVDNGFIQVDGMALEYNVAPSSRAKEFVDNIRSVQNSLARYLPPGCKFSEDPVAHFGREFMKKQPEEATRLGCDPDFNAYTGKENPTPDGDKPFRTASGHIHVGWTKDVDPFHPEHYMACRELAVSMDRFIGCMQNIWDRDTLRQELYGQLGAFRPKSYGMEYRVPSNAWTHYEDTIKMVFYSTVDALSACMTRVYPPDFESEKNTYKKRAEQKKGYLTRTMLKSGFSYNNPRLNLER